MMMVREWETPIYRERNGENGRGEIPIRFIRIQTQWFYMIKVIQIKNTQNLERRKL
jgi:hypothetical protein